MSRVVHLRCTSIWNMKALWIIKKTGGTVVGKKKNGCHLKKNVGQIDLDFDVHVYWGYICTFAWYEISIIKIIDDANDDNTRRTIHDCIGSLIFMPNEPKGEVQNHLNMQRMISGYKNEIKSATFQIFQLLTSVSVKKPLLTKTVFLR